MQILYVDLRLSDTGHTGLSTDPMSWGDVKTLMQSIADASFDTGDTFDQGLRFDATSLNLEFKLRGHGSKIAVSEIIEVSNIRCSKGSFIRFTSDDPMTNGLPLFTTDVANKPGINSALMSFNAPVNLDIIVDGVAFDVNTDDSSAVFSIAKMLNGTTSSVTMKNCVVAINGNANRCVTMTGADSTSNCVVANNTVVYGKTSAGQHEVARAEGCKLAFVRNAIAQATASTAQVICATSTISLLGGGNALALNSSSILYNAVSPSLIESDAVGLNVSRQLIWNPSIIDGNHENPFAAVDTGVSFVRSGPFALVHQTAGIGIGTNADYAYASTDAFGFDRVKGKVDAGALQKSSVTSTIEIHVDLASTGFTQNSGKEESPITLTDWLSDYGRRAPVDCSFKYVLRNSNTSVIHTLDLGPISTNSSAVSTRYNGAGLMEVTAYKPYRKSLPTLTLNKIAPNGELLVKLSSLMIKFVGGTTPNLIEPTVSSTGTLRLANCGIYSDVTAVGMIANIALNCAALQMHGCTVKVKHANGLTNGVFAVMNTKVDIACCLFDVPNAVLGSGGLTSIVGTYAFTNGSGIAAWAGANVDSYSELNGSFPFDSATSWNLSSTSTALSILPNSDNLTIDSADSLKTDARLLLRTSNTDTSYDAGMFETGVYVPARKNYYLDLAKTKSGAGIQADKWSVSDFKAWLMSDPFIDREVRVHTSRAGVIEAELPDVDFNVNGQLSFCSENKSSIATMFTSNFSVLYGAKVEVPVKFEGVILASENCSSLVNLPKSSLTLLNTIAAVRRESKILMLTLGAVTAGLVLTITSANGTAQLIEGSDWFVEDAAATLTAAIKKLGLDAITTERTIEVAGAYSIVASDASIVVAYQGYGIIASKVQCYGSSVSETFVNDIDEETDLIAAMQLDIDYSAFEGSSNGSSKTLAVAYADDANYASTAKNSVKFGIGSFGNAHVTLTNCKVCTSKVFTNGHIEGPSTTDFVLANSDAVNIAHEADVTSIAPESKMDMLGRLRSQKFTTTNDYFDAGAIETNFLDASKTFNSSADDAVAYITDAGIHLNSRSKAGNVLFKLTGYVVGRGGYVYWDPTTVDRSRLLDGAPASASVVVAGTAPWASDAMSVITPLGTVTVTHAVDFVHGSTDAETAENIATALRSKSLFNKTAWARVTLNKIEVFTWLYGSMSNGYAIAVAGPNLTKTSFGGAVDQKKTSGESWPSVGFAEWFKVEKANTRSTSYCARLAEDDAIGPIGELAVIATVIDSPFSAEIGKQYVYARVQSPLHVKTSTEIMTRRFVMCH